MVLQKRSISVPVLFDAFAVQARVRSVRYLVLLTLVFILFVIAPGTVAGQAHFEQISRGPSGEELSAGRPMISDDGHVIMFSTTFHGLGALLVRDRVTGTVSVESIGPSGEPLSVNSSTAALSADGEFVVFESSTPFGTSVFIRNLVSHTTRLIELLPDGAALVGFPIVVSADARVIAVTAATGETDSEMFVHDQSTGFTHHVALPNVEGNPRFSTYATSLDSTGRLLVFHSSRVLTTSDAPEDAGEGPDADVFVFERDTSAIERISVASDESEGNGSSYLGAISADGRFVVFRSEAANLVPDDSLNGYGSYDVFVRDRVAGTTLRVSPDRSREEPNSQNSGGAISADGRYVVYQSQAILDEGVSDLFIYEIRSGTIERIPIDPSSNENDALLPVLSGDGRLIAFATDAALLAGDTDAVRDVYVYDRGRESATAVADAFVRAGASSARNFGTATTLRVKKGLTAEYTRRGYLKFDISNDETIAKATLRLHGRVSDARDRRVRAGIFGVRNQSWGEQTVTWSTKPAYGPLLGIVTVRGTAAQWVEIDVTAFVQAEQQAGRQTISVSLRALEHTSAYASFDSRESGESGPELVITPR